MPKRVFSRTRSPRKRTSEFSTVSDGGMFESRPFVMQSKVGEEGKKSELKTSLMRAERYGHHLSQMQFAGVSDPQTVQPKKVTRQPLESQWAEAPPMQLARKRKTVPSSTSQGTPGKSTVPSSTSQQQSNRFKGKQIPIDLLDAPQSEEYKDWEQQWATKQEKVHNAMQQFVPRFQALDQNAQVQIRGSLASGIKLNKKKVSSDGKRLLFNPTDFDIDAYVVSDKLFKEAITQSPDAAGNGQIPGSRHNRVNAIIRDMRKVLANIAGNRDSPHPDKSWNFNVLIRTNQNTSEAQKTDTKAMKSLGKPPNWADHMVVPPPEKKTKEKSG